MSARAPLGDAERLDWLRLSRSENVGPITFFQLLRRFGSAAAALEAIPDLARRGGRARPITVCAKAEAEAELAAAARIGAVAVAAREPAYPAALATIADPPPVLFLLGHPHLAAESARAVAVVGARNASANGIRFARTLAAELGEAGLVVVSGLARGIDAAAHGAALATGTVAVMAGGVDVPYPSENEPLYRDIAERGLLLSEQPMAVQPQARHFPRRNRLISGAAAGVVVVEAAPRSGSLITARMALEQGREVFAVPGSPLDPRCRGTNNLLREGATLTETAGDVIAALGSLRPLPLTEADTEAFESAAGASPDDRQLAEARAKIVELLGPSPAPIDELVRQSRLTPAIVLTILLELELAGRAARHPGNQVSTR